VHVEALLRVRELLTEADEEERARDTSTSVRKKSAVCVPLVKSMMGGMKIARPFSTNDDAGTMPVHSSS